jgi:molybdopterin-dependent oxidoreductase alpha subunit
MGGQRGGMVNEGGRGLEVCKKSIQAMSADMGGAIHSRFFSENDIDRMRAMSPRELEAAGRIVFPLYKGPDDTRYMEVDWDSALERIAKKLLATPPDEGFFYFSGRSSNEAGFLLQLFARLYGTNNVNNCSYYCHQASGVGLNSVVGSGTATVVLEDLEQCDLLFVIGANPSCNHPRLMKAIVEHRRRGGKVIVINPLRELGLERFKVPSDPRSLLFGSKIADLYVQPHIGGDIALIYGIAKAVQERGGVDESFVSAHTAGWDEFRAHIESLEWENIINNSGVDREVIYKIAEMYVASARTIFSWAMGITHHKHGVENVQSIANLAMMRGMLGRPGCGLLPLRGHSNVQGIGSMGVTPALKQDVFEKLESEFGFAAPSEPGLDTLECITRAHGGHIKFGWCLGGNLYGSNPDSRFAGAALNAIDTVVYMSTTLNTGHAWGTGRETFILPVLPRDEEPQATTQESMFNFVRLSDGGSPRHAGPRSEIDIIATVASLVVGDDSPVDWTGMRRHRTIRRAIGRIISGYDKIGEIDETGQEFQISGRTFHEPRFATPDGKARFNAVSIPPLEGMGEHQLRLMTVRSEGQFNTIVYEDEDIYRGQERRNIIMMNIIDVQRLGLSVDQPVRVYSDTGTMTGIIVRTIDIPCGNAAMYYPEANVLIPKVADARSRTPAFKNVAISITA